MSGTDTLELHQWCTAKDLPQDFFLFDNSDCLCPCVTGGGVLPVKFYLGTLLPPVLYNYLENMVCEQRKFGNCWSCILSQWSLFTWTLTHTEIYFTLLSQSILSVHRKTWQRFQVMICLAYKDTPWATTMAWSVHTVRKSTQTQCWQMPTWSRPWEGFWAHLFQ